MTSQFNQFAENLFAAPLQQYADWPNSDVPNGPGVYAVWLDEELVWVGSAGGSVRSRLERHVKGQRRASKFLKAVYARLMFRHLGLEKAMQMAGETQLLVDAITARFVKEKLTYRYLATTDESTADQIANVICSGGSSSEKPFLNAN